MALVITFTPGESFDEEGDTITLNKLNRVINSGTGQISSGSLDADSIGDLQVTAAKLEATLNLTGKTVTLPVDQDLGFRTAATKTALLVPAYKGQVGVLDTGEIFIANDTSANSDWLWGGVIVEDSILAAPDHPGQWALVDGVTYRAREPDGDEDPAAADWLPVCTDWIDFKNQDADPDAASGSVRLYAKSNVLYHIPSSGSPQAIGENSESSIVRFVTDNGVVPGPTPWANGEWITLEFNEMALDAGFINADLSENQFGMEAGTYDYTYIINYSLQLSAGSSSQRCTLASRLQNVTTGSEATIPFSNGTQGLNFSGDLGTSLNPPGSTHMTGRFTIDPPAEGSATAYLELQVWTFYVNTTPFMAYSDGSGNDEVWATIRFTKIA